MEEKKGGKMHTLFRWLVPGFLFQSVVIGGGYGTGNEIAQYFGVHGMVGGFIGIIVTMISWAIVAAVTFEVCRVFKVYDYNSMSHVTLGKGAFLYEISYIFLMLIVLGVINGAAMSMFNELTGLTGWIGVAILSVGIIFLVIKGTETIEKVLSFWSYVLYAVYIIFMVITFVKFSDTISGLFAHGVSGTVTDTINGEEFSVGGTSLGSCIVDGLRYSFYNLGIIPAILYSVRDCNERKEAVGRGLIAGALATIPAMLLLLALGCDLTGATYNALNNGTAVSIIFQHLDMRWLYILFEIVLFGTLIETGSGFIKAVDDRIEVSYTKMNKEVPSWVRPVVAIGLTLFGVAISTFGLTALISKGYGTVCWLLLIVYVIPMLTVGIYKVHKATSGSGGGEEKDKLTE